MIVTLLDVIIRYVFTSSNPIPGYTVFEGELIVLVMRVLTPIHVLCSVLQAAQLSKVLLGTVRLSLFQVLRDALLYLFISSHVKYRQILLPAITLHGTFDFVLFLLSTLDFVYNDNGGLFGLLSLVMIVLLTICGFCWAYFSFKHVRIIVSDIFNTSLTCVILIGSITI